jgi:hypothetical protein
MEDFTAFAGPVFSADLCGSAVEGVFQQPAKRSEAVVARFDLAASAFAHRFCQRDMPRIPRSRRGSTLELPFAFHLRVFAVIRAFSRSNRFQLDSARQAWND